MSNFTLYGVVGQPVNYIAHDFTLMVSLGYTIGYYVAVPDGLTLNNSTPVMTITGTPTGVYFGINQITGSQNIDDEEDDIGNWNVFGTFVIIEFSYPNTIYYLNSPISIAPIISGEGGFIPTSFSISPALPTGLSINPTTGVIEGTPTVIEDDNIVYTVTFEDPNGTSYSTTIDMWGSHVNFADLYITNGVEFSVFPTITGASPGNYEFTSPPPNGIEINYFTGEISGIPDSETGTIEMTITFLVNSVQFSENLNIYLSNPDCLAGNANILTSSGYKRIDAMVGSDKLVSDKQKIVKIKKIHIIPDYRGELYCIPKQSLSPVYPINDIYATANHEYCINNRWYKPHKKQKQNKIQLKNAINLYHIELDNPDDNLVVNGITMESYRSKHLN